MKFLLCPVLMITLFVPIFAPELRIGVQALSIGRDWVDLLVEREIVELQDPLELVEQL